MAAAIYKASITPLQPQTVHLSDDEDPRKTEGKHRPDVVPLHDRKQCTVKGNTHLLHQHPPLIQMNTGKEQTTLQEQQEHVQESDQMTGCVNMS